jgi:hypothetical protein
MHGGQGKAPDQYHQAEQNPIVTSSMFFFLLFA